MLKGEVPMVEDDNDWLVDMIAESAAMIAEKDVIAKAKKKLASGSVSKSEHDELQEIVDRYEEARIWEAVAQVALLHVQACNTCGHNEYMFQGWMVEQRHRHQPTTRRLVAGESQLKLPIRKERHYLKPRDQCIHCLDSYIRAKQAIVPYLFTNHRKDTE